MTNKPQIGFVLRAVLAVGLLFGPFARTHLKRRLAKGKEDPDRWQEKLGVPSQARPDGPLIWLHGVGVGEAMALRGLVEGLAHARPELNFLVTSSARSSADVFAQNLPANARHQYLPLDLPGPVAAFLDHWRPDLAVWSDQEVWPRLAVTAARRGIAQAYVAARITEKSARAKARFGAAFGDLYRLMDVRHAQDDTTRAALIGLMNDDSPVKVTGSIKAAAAPLSADPDTLRAFAAIAAQRRIWVLAPSHPADEELALKAHKRLHDTEPDALLIIVPRVVSRAADIAWKSANMGFVTQVRSSVSTPDAQTTVYIADTYGELGVWYAAAPIALIGGTFDETEGHNPWEAVALDCAVMYGPCTANFARVYDHLASVQGARKVKSDADIVKALRHPDMQAVAARAKEARDLATKGQAEIVGDLLALLDD